MRELVPEVMDDPGLAEDLHEQALHGLRRLNAVSRSAACLWPAVRDAARERNGTVRVMDLACGGGDVGLSLVKRAARAGVDLAFTGVDVSPVALDYARRAARSAGANERTTWVQADVLQDGLPGTADVVMSNLFMHHLTGDDTVAVLKAMREAAAESGARVLINDLCRAPVTRALVGLGCRMLSRSPVVHVDGPRSARAAWTVKELEDLAGRAGLDGAHVRRLRPCRMLLAWSRP